MRKGLGFHNRHSPIGYSRTPGPPWLVADSAGNNFLCSANVLSSTGVVYVVTAAVLSSNGTAYNPI